MSLKVVLIIIGSFSIIVRTTFGECSQAFINMYNELEYIGGMVGLKLLSENVARILSRTLNLIDYRIVDHCERVAYIVIEMLKAEGGYSPKELVEIYFLCMLHDIGAFKTEEIDVLTDINVAMDFEINNTVDHVAYGYTFVKKFSSLDKYVDAILYHHTRYDELMQSDCQNKSLAAKIFLADRADIYMIKGDLSIDENYFYRYRDSVFSAKDIDLLVDLEKTNNISEKLNTGYYQQQLTKLCCDVQLTKDQVTALLRTIAYAIDFRSEFTVMHTITTVGISVEIAKLMNMDEDNIEKIFLGSLLHDLGKIATSIMLLEKSGKLDDYEYTMMKDHVVVTESILTGLVDDEILKIAIRHHEKLDGSGYPYGLTAQDLNINELIVCVADIFSALSGQRSYKDPFPAEQIKSILQKMADNNKLNKNIVKFVLENYTLITENAKISYDDAMKRYYSISEQYKVLREKLINRK